MPKICYYCASSDLIDIDYKNQTRDVTNHLIQLKYDFVYGGGATGLMGCMADTVLDSDRHVTGVIPHFMKELEWNHPKVEDMIFVDTMSERKQKFFELSDAIITLPGGCGTLEELSEAITLKQLGKINHRLIIANFNGFFDPLLQQLERMISQKFMRPEHNNIWESFRTLEEFKVLMNKSTSEINADLKISTKV